MLTSIRKPAHRNLLDWEKEFNRQVNKIRYVIEQTIANFKTWRIMHTDYRRPLATSTTTMSLMQNSHEDDQEALWPATRRRGRHSLRGFCISLYLNRNRPALLRGQLNNPPFIARDRARAAATTNSRCPARAGRHRPRGRPAVDGPLRLLRTVRCRHSGGPARHHPSGPLLPGLHGRDAVTNLGDPGMAAGGTDGVVVGGQATPRSVAGRQRFARQAVVTGHRRA